MIDMRLVGVSDVENANISSIWSNFGEAGNKKNRKTPTNQIAFPHSESLFLCYPHWVIYNYFVFLNHVQINTKPLTASHWSGI